jgi:Domain of unknown function (DUF4349)
MPRLHRRLPQAAAVLLFSLLLVACSGSSTGQAPDAAEDPEVVGGIGDDSDPQASEPAEEPTGGSDRPAGNAAPIEQRIIKTGEVGLEVDNVAAMLARVRAMAVELGGYVGGSQAGTLDESATVTLRIPATRFDEVLSRLHEIEDAEVISESTREQDVTREIVDLRARITNLEASEASYRVLLDRAKEIEDILTVQSRLDDVRGQIEQLEGQLQTVEGQADLSTLTVTIIPRGEPVAEVQATWDPRAQLEGAVAALVGLGQGVFNVLVWIFIVWVPVLLILGVVALVVVRVTAEVRRRLPATDAAVGGEGPTA